MRIGVYGGSFDPPHIGHQRLAEAALEQLQLDEVLFMPANRNPQKAKPTKTPAKHRLEMVKRLAHQNEAFSVSDLDLTRGGPSFAIESLSELQMARPAEYWFLMGADTARDFEKWKSPERILKLARLGVAVRPPASEAQVVARMPEYARPFVDIVRMTPVDISSSDLREKLQRGQSIVPWVDPGVLQYIKENKLYKNP